VGQEFASEAEAERLLAADPYRRQRIGLVGQTKPVPGVVVGQRGAFFVTQEVQVARHGTPRHLELLDEVAAVRQIAGLGALAHHLHHAPDTVVLGPGTRLHFPQTSFRGMPLVTHPPKAVEKNKKNRR